MALLRSVCWLLCVTLVVQGAPSPGRVPKVYNALITSGQNLTPSKSFPIYQPVFHEALGFPLQPTFYYGDNDFKNWLPNGVDLPPPQFRQQAAPTAPGSPEPTDTTGSPQPSSPTGDTDPRDTEPTERLAARRQDPAEAASPTASSPKDAGAATAAPPPPPATRPPIPLNEFGLPPAIVPLSRTPEYPRPLYAFDPYYPQFAPFYPQYNPYSDPSNFQSYPLVPPLYRFGAEPPAPAPPASPAPSSSDEPSTPPPAPANLNIYNYIPENPDIRIVPPPPLLRGGFKDDRPKTNQ